MQQLQNRGLELFDGIDRFGDQQAALSPRADPGEHLRVDQRHGLGVDLLDQEAGAVTHFVVEHVERADVALETEFGEALARGLADHDVRTFDHLHQAGQHAGNAAVAKLDQDHGLDQRIGVVQRAEDQGVGLGTVEVGQGLGGGAPAARAAGST